MIFIFMNIIRQLFTKIRGCFRKPNQSHMNTYYLQNVEYADTIPYIPELTYGKVVKVYDGDTITIASQLHGSSTMYRFSIRLAGIDTPEIKSHNPLEKERAIYVRNQIHDLLFGKIIRLTNISMEKYGRVLADIYLDDLHINDYIIQHKYGYKYDGGQKQLFTGIAT